VIPFKRVTSQSLRLKNLFKDNKISIKKGQGIKGIGQQVKEALAVERTLEGDKILADEVKKIRD
jgi:hypothetical protein